MKKMIIGIVIGLFLGISTNAFAAIGDTVSAVFASFNYVVNGTAKAIDSPVLVHEGTSYVRTTDIANMLGFDVTYKSDSRTIEFNNPLSTTTATGVTSPVLEPSATPTASIAPSTSPSASVTPAPTTSPDPSASPAPSASPTPTASPEPSASPSASPTITPSPTPAPTPAPTVQPPAVDTQLYFNCKVYKDTEWAKLNCGQ